MDLSHLRVEARPRSPWEALDLGLTMARQWWSPLFWSWFIPAASLFCLLSLVLYEYSLVPGIIVWWLKPLWDRGPLYIASRNIFGETVTLRETLLKLPELYKTDWFLCLTWRRFSLTRSFDMPLTVLENVKGKQRSSRLSSLHKGHAGPASWLTVIGFFFEALFPSVAGMLIYFMLPENLEIAPLDIFIEGDTINDSILEVLAVIAMGIMGTLYSLSGFALYISRRIELEAWDIEMSFRRLAATVKTKLPLSVGSNPVGNSHSNDQETHTNPKKNAAQKATTLCASLVICLTLLGATLSPSPSFAASAENQKVEVEVDTSSTLTPSESNIAAKEQIIEALEDRAFHQVDTVRGWRLKTTDASQYPEWSADILELMFWLGSGLRATASFFSSLSVYIEIILWTVGLTLIAFALYHYRKAIRNFKINKRIATSPQVPSVLFGLDLRRDSLPENIPQTVTALWQKQSYREAISLLYRAMLSGMIHQHGFTFLDGHTEGECARIVKQRGSQELTEYSQLLTSCWQQLAYGHVLPEYSNVEILCQRWEVIFPNE